MFAFYFAKLNTLNMRCLYIATRFAYILLLNHNQAVIVIP